MTTVEQSSIQEIKIYVEAGVEKAGSLITKHQVIDLSLRPHCSDLRISSINETEEGAQVEIQLHNHSSSTRLHLFCSQFVPTSFANDSFVQKMQYPSPQNQMIATGRVHKRNSFASGNSLGSEVRYILERKYSRVFPGNSLPRPSLLLNPFSTGYTTSQEHEQEVQSRALDDLLAGAMCNRALPCAINRNNCVDACGSSSMRGSSSFEFLMNPSVALFNLKPDKAGKVVVEKRFVSLRRGINGCNRAQSISQPVTHSPLAQALRSRNILGSSGGG